MEDARVAVMTLSPSDDGAATRSSIEQTEGTGNRKVTWSVADEIYWWTSPAVSGTPGDKRKYTVLADSESVEIPVSYRDNDQYVTFYTAGRGVGGGTTPDMTQLTFSVPQRQDGTFASNHVAVHKSKLILEASAASMKPVATMLRFTLSTLTYAGQTVNNIRIGCMDGSSRLWGDFKVTMDNTTLGAVSSVDKTADAVADASPVIIDKRASAFQTGVPYYVAVRPSTAAWPQGIYFDLYSGDTKLARVIVRDSADGGFTLSHGKIRDLGDLKAHANIPTTATQMTMYPPYAAFTKDMPSAGKKFWLRVEPEDFSGTIEWTVTDMSGNPSTDFTITSGARENLTIDGKTVSCWTATVGHTGNPAYSDVKLGKVKATAKVKGEADVTKSAEIEMGEFIEMGSIDKDGTRVLWCWGELAGGATVSCNDESAVVDFTGHNFSLKSLLGDIRAWGYMSIGRVNINYYHKWERDKPSEEWTTSGFGGKYLDASGVLEDVDNACKAYARLENKYGYSNEGGIEVNQWDYPYAEDFSILSQTSNQTKTNVKPASGKHTFTSTNIGYTDCSIVFTSERNYWSKNYVLSYPAQAMIGLMNENPMTLGQQERCCWRNVSESSNLAIRIRPIRRAPVPAP